jgi:hypothetical protein
MSNNVHIFTLIQKPIMHNEIYPANLTLLAGAAKRTISASGRLLLRPRRKRPCRRAAKREDAFSPSDMDCHAPLPAGVMQ